MNISFKRRHIRVKKAKLAHLVDRPGVIRTVDVGVLALVAAVISLWFVAQPLSIMLSSLPISLLIFRVWVRGDLARLRNGDFDQDEEEAVRLELIGSPDLIRHLGRNIESSQAIFKKLRKTWAMNFFATRFGLLENFFEAELTEEGGQAVFRRAIEFSRAHNLRNVPTAAVILGLAEQLPKDTSPLPALGLTIGDIESGVLWAYHIEETAHHGRIRRRWGRISTEWTAGYTPLLNRMARNVTALIQSGIWQREVSSHKQSIDSILQQISQSPKTNIALVGDIGVGKTRLVYALADRLMTEEAPKNIQGYQVFELNAGDLLSQASSNVPIEFLFTSILREAQHAGASILFLDDAHLFFENNTGAINVANLLNPLFESGGLPVILSFTPKTWQTLQAEHQQTAALLSQMTVKPTEAMDTLQILQDQAIVFEYQRNVLIAYQALKESIRVADQYVHELSQPGRAIQTLETSISYAQGGVVSKVSVQQSVEQGRGVKVQTAQADEKQTLLNLEDLIHKRLINQKRAVTAVAEALRRSRSGVANQKRPMGTFLFLGPTGVGKTELSRALADIVFSGEDQLVRLDMNEFSSPDSVVRLVNADPRTANSLVAQIKKQPYSVVLLDEIEKAHSAVQDALLQLLDEGVLRDSNNEDVSFRDAIIIATSNAGAQSIRERIETGEDVEAFEQEFIDQLINSSQFKPEFLNRFDEVVLFRPLTQGELLKVVDLQLKQVNQQLSDKQITVKLTDDAKQWLAEQGYDPRLGARPLRRVMQRSVESVLADRLLRDQVQPGQELELTKADLS